MNAPARRPLNYYGSKWQIAKWIIAHFPPHAGFVDACFGGGAVLLQKPRCKLETANDIDNEIINFFTVLRNDCAALVEALNNTPYAETEYNAAFEAATDPVERARRLFLRSWAGVAGYSRNPSSFRVNVNPYGRGVMASADIINIGHLYAVRDRLRGVQILNRDALDLIGRFCNAPGTLIYFDPPYVTETRSNRSNYVFEWSQQQHIDAATLLRQHNGFAVVSGYACALYTELYENAGWARVDKPARANSGATRVESLWLSPATATALKPVNFGLFRPKTGGGSYV